MSKNWRRPGNIKMQMHERLNQLNCIGQSRHLAKQEHRAMCENSGFKYNAGKTIGIHSDNTMEAYKDTVNQFSEWLKTEHKGEYKLLEDITKDVCYEFLQLKQEGNSAWTTSRHMSALNKIFRLDLTKKEGGLKMRKVEDITRSRENRLMDKRYNPDNYKDQIEFSKAFGLRRESVLGGQYQVKNISLFKQNGKVYCSVIEKGGKYREAPCLKEFQQSIESKYNIQERGSLTKGQFIKLYKENKDNRLFDRYSKHIDNHAFRSEYAMARYDEVIQEKLDQGENIIYDKKHNGKMYNVKCLSRVSLDIGHGEGRITDILNHYMR